MHGHTRLSRARAVEQSKAAHLHVVAGHNHRAAAQALNAGAICARAQQTNAAGQLVGKEARPAGIRARPHVDGVDQIAGRCVATSGGAPGPHLIQRIEDKAEGIHVPLQAIVGATGAVGRAHVKAAQPVLGIAHVGAPARSGGGGVAGAARVHQTAAVAQPEVVACRVVEVRVLHNLARAHSRLGRAVNAQLGPVQVVVVVLMYLRCRAALEAQRRAGVVGKVVVARGKAGVVEGADAICVAHEGVIDDLDVGRCAIQAHRCGAIAQQHAAHFHQRPTLRTKRCATGCNQRQAKQTCAACAIRSHQWPHHARWQLDDGLIRARADQVHAIGKIDGLFVAAGRDANALVPGVNGRLNAAEHIYIRRKGGAIRQAAHVIRRDIHIAKARPHKHVATLVLKEVLGRRARAIRVGRRRGRKGHARRTAINHESIARCVRGPRKVGHRRCGLPPRPGRAAQWRNQIAVAHVQLVGRCRHRRIDDVKGRCAAGRGHHRDALHVGGAVARHAHALRHKAMNRQPVNLGAQRSAAVHRAVHARVVQIQAALGVAQQHVADARAGDVGDLRRIRAGPAIHKHAVVAATYTDDGEVIFVHCKGGIHARHHVHFAAHRHSINGSLNGAEGGAVEDQAIVVASQAIVVVHHHVAGGRRRANQPQQSVARKAKAGGEQTAREQGRERGRAVGVHHRALAGGWVGRSSGR